MLNLLRRPDCSTAAKPINIQVVVFQEKKKEKGGSRRVMALPLLSDKCPGTGTAGLDVLMEHLKGTALWLEVWPSE